MNIAVTSDWNSIEPHDVIVCPFFTDDDLGDVPELKRLGSAQLQGMLDRRDPRGTLYHLAFVPPDSGPGILLVGAGPRANFDAFYWSRVIAAGTRFLAGRGYTSLALIDRGGSAAAQLGEGAIVGAETGSYTYSMKTSNREGKRQLDRIVVLTGPDRTAEARLGASVGEVVGESHNVARDLVNSPPNDLTPSILARRATDLAQKYGLECEILDENRMRELGMGSLLGVAAGSAEPPRLIVLRCGDAHAKIKLGLVGKGLTFDSGGLSLKTADGMETMKSDMGGAAAVIGGIVAAARLNLPNVSITAFVGATENMPGGHAMRPGDVLTAMSGETIEVLNTDAEGRLVLADVLTYAVRQGCTHLVDFATLTGGAVVALGSAASLATGRPTAWVEAVVESATDGLDRAWPMPMYPEYRKTMDSDVADIKNTGGRWGSALTAAAFLSDFVDGTPWAHMDIAGTAFLDDEIKFAAKGATGVGVGTIVALARRLSAMEEE